MDGWRDKEQKRLRKIGEGKEGDIKKSGKVGRHRQREIEIGGDRETGIEKEDIKIYSYPGRGEDRERERES